MPANVPAGIRRLLRRSLEKDLKRRLDSAGGVRIEIDEALTTPAAAPDGSPRPSTASRWPRLLPWGLAAALAIGLAASLLPSREQPEARGLVRFTVAPPFGFVRRTAVMRFAISPDGQAVAFTATGPDGISRAMTRRLFRPFRVAWIFSPMSRCVVARAAELAFVVGEWHCGI